MKQTITLEFYKFFKLLAANNHKDWFDAHRTEYEQNVKGPFEDLVTELIQATAKTNPEFSELRYKDCIFRINRDIRFSKDKTPYKLNRSAIIAPEGRKFHGPGGFYLELGPEECALYAGAYALEKENLKGIREAINTEWSEFNQIVNQPGFVKTFGKVLGEKQKRLEPAFQEIAKREPLMFNTQFYIKHAFPQERTLKKDFVPFILKIYAESLAFTDFLKRGYRAQDEQE
jgi:uncharacterized protein (TIGR02453 family)